MITFFAFLILSRIMAVKSQVPSLGPCPELRAMPNFDLNRYLGKWYESERYFAVFEFGGKCVTADYNYDLKAASINMINKQISAITGIRSTIEGVVNQIGRSSEGKLTINFPSLPLSFDAPYWVLGTDYDNYAVIWSCTSFGLFSTRNAWIMTRVKNPSLKVIEKAYSVLDKNAINRTYFIRTDQKNCPHIY